MTMSETIAVIGTVVQLLAVAAGAPLLIGLMRQVRARLEGRRGPGVGQLWRDLRKLVRKHPLRPDGTTVVFMAAPLVLAGTTLCVVAIVPVVTTKSTFDSVADLFAVVGLLLAGTVAVALAGLDTGTAFGGMGASRSMTIGALVEPTVLLAVFALSIPVHSSNLGAIVDETALHPGHVVTPAAALAFAALAVVVIAESGRLPVDNPTTHLELTMIHEAMTLEYTGSQLALLEWASAMRLTVLLALLSNLFAPFGIAASSTHTIGAGVGHIAIALGVIILKVALLGALLAAGEVFVAKLRLFRVPELLAGSFVLGLMAVTASYFLANPVG
jgi:formate hydrogenlyase subunit 4